jgi:hypothetical protein
LTTHEAIAVYQKVANENPTFAPAHQCLANAYWGKHMYPQVIEELKAYGQLPGEMNLISLLPWNKDFVPRGWKGALAEEAVRRNCCYQAITLVTFWLRVQWGFSKFSCFINSAT